MKVKSIITCGLLLLGVGAATTSCEDMFTAENKLVTTDLAPQDTVYQIMGIVQRMQKLADRTVLLGEIRADLVDVNTTVASTDLQQLYNNNVDENNIYNRPADYYDVINNCNIYLAYVDDQLKTHGTFYYEKEICAAKCFRAWCYLELAKIYGEAPLVTEPVLTADDAENVIASGNKADVVTILDFCISDLEQYPYMADNLRLRPSYGSQTWNDITYDNFFIPVRALLAELYLWRASCEGKSDTARDYYIKAIRMYHDYFCFPNEERGVRNNTSQWMDRNHASMSYSYPSRFSVGATTENAAVLPCDTVAYYGNVSNLSTVFNSQYANNYYPWVSPSARIRSISAAQDNCYYDKDNQETVYFSHDPNDYVQSTLVGDLRLFSVYQTTSNPTLSQSNGDYNATISYIMKWTNGGTSIGSDVKNPYIPFFRNTILYLHMAEALNRAGFPATAFAVLKYGLTKDVMDNRDIIQQAEFDALCEIKSYGFPLRDPGYIGELSDKTNSSFVIWPSNVFYNVDNKSKTPSTPNARIPQIGVHSNGSGIAELNAKYYLPTDSSQVIPVPSIITRPLTVQNPGEMMTREEWEPIFIEQYKKENNGAAPSNRTLTNRWAEYQEEYDKKKKAYEQYLLDMEEYYESIRVHDEAVAINDAWFSTDGVRTKRMEALSKIILEEEALEGMFEGHRFYDLMRYQMQEGQFTGGVDATIKMPQHIIEKYGDTQRDGMENKPWYLKLPTR